MAPNSPLQAFPDLDPTSPTRAFISKALLIAYVAALAALAIHAMVTGPQIRAALDLEIAQQIAEEDRAFCQEFGKQTGMPEFTACAHRLGEVRARHKDRILRDLSPIL